LENIMERITERHLEILCGSLNELTDNPVKPYVADDTGRMRAQIGNYHISHAYGGVCLHQMMNEGGGVNSPLSTGHIPKRELFGLMHAYLAGMRKTA
jgi:hypothetical protein